MTSDSATDVTANCSDTTASAEMNAPEDSTAHTAATNRADLTARAYLPALDSLRGLAAVVVVVSHSANRGYLPELFGRGLGGTGVTMFYALSGFLMAYLYLHRPFNGDQVRSFVIARVARVFPLYYACLAMAMIAFYGFGWVLYVANNALDFATAMLMIRAKDVLWSIPTEVQFYVLFLILWWGRGRGLFWLIAAGMVAAEAVCLLTLEGANNTLLKWGHVFGCGMLIALWLERSPSRTNSNDVLPSFTPRSPAVRPARSFAPMMTLVAWLSPLLFILSMPQIRRWLAIDIFSPDAPIDPLQLAVPLLMLAFAIYRVGPYPALEHSWLRWLGSVSYGVYLLHMPILHGITAVSDTWHIPVIVRFPLLLSLTLLAAQLSKTLLEIPTQRWGNRFRHRSSTGNLA